MTTTPNPHSASIEYPAKTLQRAKRALYSSPFQLNLFTTMRSQSVPLQVIAGQSGIEYNYTQHSLAELVVESELVWLIQVGLLRREVDGQGITDSFRLTPLGRKLVDQWEQNPEELSSLTRWERINNALNRWLRLPF